MKRDHFVLKSIVLAFAVLLFCLPVRATETSASFAYIMDYETGITLYEKNADVPMSPASMSKLMTTYVVFDALRSLHINLADEFLVSTYAHETGGEKSGSSTMFLIPGKKVSVEDLLRGVIVQSGNDASIVLAEGLAGSEADFVDIMNRLAGEIGLTNSQFANATGWPHESHKMSARDLGRLSYLLISEFPEYYPMFVEKSFSWNGIKQMNRNPLLALDIGVDGLKTGYTEESRYGLAASAEREGRRIIVVLNGLSSKRERAAESRRMLSWAFRAFRSEVFIEAGELLTGEDGSPLDVSIWQGAEARVALTVADDFNVIIPRLESSNMVVSAIYQDRITAPIKKGDILGHLTVVFPNLESQKVDLVAVNDVARQGVLGRIISGLAYMLFE